MKEKQLYTAPEADLLVVRFEGTFLTTSGGTEVGTIIATDDWD